LSDEPFALEAGRWQNWHTLEIFLASSNGKKLDQTGTFVYFRGDGTSKVVLEQLAKRLGV
jgi:hypothetical protein